MKKHTTNKNLVVALMASVGLLSSCSLVQTPGTAENTNLKKTAPIVVKGSEGFASKLTADGGCDRGAFVIDVMNNTGAYGNKQDAIYASGKGYFTSKSWADKKVNPFHMIGFEKGEPTFPVGAKPEVPFLADVNKVDAMFFEGDTPSSNAIDEGTGLSQAEALGLKAIGDVEVADGEEKVSTIPLDQTYQLVLHKGEEARLANYYLGNIPKMDVDIPGVGKREAVGNAVEGEKKGPRTFGVKDFTHFAFGKEGMGNAVYMVPADIENKTKSFTTSFSASIGDPLEINLGARGKELPAGAKAAYINVQLFHVNPKDKLKPMAFNVVDSGQTSVAIPTEGLDAGDYWMIAKRSYLYSSPVVDEEGGNFCVLAGAAASARVKTAAKE